MSCSHTSRLQIFTGSFGVGEGFQSPAALDATIYTKKVLLNPVTWVTDAGTYLKLAFDVIGCVYSGNGEFDFRRALNVLNYTTWRF